MVVFTCSVLSNNPGNAEAAIGGEGEGGAGGDDVAVGTGSPTHPATKVQVAKAATHIELFIAVPLHRAVSALAG
ncbi:hypothetical protein AWC19_18900 [Mycobacterium palustre]|uniref:Uncharacterized protein n=2 Tax=Mycobacterium palustre TaxID=153971 RepID=A0A1X1Z5Y4_9MYCO|nr:hypothetical protein AWC19_18900 [Mycobacterium palustre]